MGSSSEKVTEMLLDWGRGDRAALDRLMAAVYRDLRTQAARALRRERSEHALEPTALVHEAYLRLVDQRRVDWRSRAHFFGIAARLMRQVLVDHARRRDAAKRGGPDRAVPLEDTVAGSPGPSLDVVALDLALERLEALSERQARVVELRYFAGLGVEETADVLEVSPATVKNDWAAARAWLRGQLDAGRP